MQFLCTAEDVDPPCPHRFRMFYMMMRSPRTGRFIGSLWVCETCLNRVEKPQPRKTGDLPLFHMNGETDVEVAADTR